ncbi:hypothetical protein [Thiomicrospira sp. WB1]|uniref:hypothetical protein n=1 Tax=Thiomicrospira sp. WB1 TaxID=1685380 RepID=UPI00128ECDA5|nr:hypothetical protein [Thiomicrospira sp. WB1]
MMSYPKMNNPKTGKPFERGNKCPFNTRYSNYGDAGSNTDLYFNQYCCSRPDKYFRNYAYMHFCEAAVLERKKEGNRLTMQKRSTSMSVSQMLGHKVKNFYRNKKRIDRPYCSEKELVKALEEDWYRLPSVAQHSNVKLCPVLSIKMFMKSDNVPQDHYASIHRLNNALGYTPDNVVWISYRANRLISDGSYEEFEKICQYLK